jgi:outer membrane protein insertion porin family
LGTSLGLFDFSGVSSKAFAEVVAAKNAKLKNIEWNSAIDVKNRFNPYFQELIGKPWDILNFKIKLDQVTKELFLNGYFSSTVKYEVGGSESAIIVKLSIETKDRTNFQFLGNTLFSHQQLRLKIIDKIKNDFGKIDRGGLGIFLNEVYEEAGFYNTSVQSYQNEGKDLAGVVVRNYFFNITEGKKIPVTSLIYRGNSALSTSELTKVYQKHATILALSGFYDKTFFDNFPEIIKKEYLSRGFVFAEVSLPKITSNSVDDSVVVGFDISEKQQVLLKSITLKTIDKNLQESLKNILINKEGSPLNVVELENDFKKIVTHFQDQGYYFTTIANLNDDSLLVYDKSFSYAEIKPDIILDRKVCFNEAIINGNSKTLTKVINREINLEKGELITPAKLEKFRQNLSGLGLFSSLKINPYILYEGDEILCAKTNLSIQVKEKDFGLGEFAPGYRTDLGYKASVGITYNNLGGLNRSLSFHTQANLRTNRVKKLLEHSTRASYIEPYLFHDFLKTQVEFELSTSFQRKRLTSFDADIFKVSPQLSKSFKQYISTVVRYQFERINQFNATTAVNNDNYSIGGVTPSITVDLRDDPINPRKGMYFTLSSEWANDYFGSMKNDELEINYVKIINRNKFYLPVGDFTLAFSLAMGYQKNFADQQVIDPSTNLPKTNLNGLAKTRGYIPNIKVFRLDGYDEIRGYDEGEINRSRNGLPIDGLIVQNEAYFTAFKFEPRYNLTDAIQLGVFFDAGQVHVGSFQPFDLRTSVGAGVKFLTPVGSLDFDYGIKLQRKVYPDATRDAAGKFHLSIGFF